MNHATVLTSRLLIPALVLTLVGSIVTDRFERKEQPRNTAGIAIFDQGHYTAELDDDRWALPGWDYGMNQHRSLSTAGCHTIAYAHAIQWITGEVRGDALLDELLRVCRNPSDQEENSHAKACEGLHDVSIFSKDAYDAYLLEQYNIQAVELEQTPEVLAAHFAAGGAVITLLPGHYVVGIEMKEVAGRLYVHVIDSNWGTTRRKGYEMVFIGENNIRVRILSIADGTYTHGSDYWVPYETYSQWMWKTPLRPLQ